MQVNNEVNRPLVGHLLIRTFFFCLLFFVKEKRQTFVEYTNEIKVFTNDPEKNFNKLSKDEKVK